MSQDLLDDFKAWWGSDVALPRNPEQIAITSFQAGWNAARAPAPAMPDVSRLLAAAKEAMGYIPDRRDHAAAKAELRAAVAEHEAAARPSGRGGIVEGMEALREAGGKAWDDVEMCTDVQKAP